MRAAALSADGVKDAAARDAALKRAGKRGTPAQPLDRLRAVLVGWAAADQSPTPAAVEAELAKMPAGARADAELFVGWFLNNRGLGERAAAHWERCTGAADDGTRLLKTHALAFLEGRAKTGPAGKKD